MALNTVSKRAIDGVSARLSHAATGFNAGIVAQAPTYGITPTNFVQIDWTSQSHNFVFGQINPDLLEQTGIITYPFACMYILESAQTGMQKFSQFSGIVRCIFEVWLSWRQIKGLQDHEKYPNCVEDVTFDVINRKENQNWTNPLVYNGGIQCKRGPLTFAGENFRQRVGFSMLFEVHQ